MRKRKCQRVEWPEVTDWQPASTRSAEEVMAAYRAECGYNLSAFVLEAMLHDLSLEQLVECVRTKWQAETAALRAARQQRDAANASANGAADDHRTTGKGDSHE